MDDLRVRIAGNAYTGWIEASVSRALDQFVGSFELLYADRWAEADRPRLIVPWDACEVSFGRHTLLTGYVDSITGDMQRDALTLRTSGRARTADLVDCSIRHATGHWKDQTLLQIVSDVCEPFGISVTLDPSVQATNELKFERVEADDGEAVYDLIQRICNVRGVLPVTTASGDLLLTRITRYAKLRTVVLPVAETLTRSWRHETHDLFSEYFLRSQTGRRKNENGSRAALEAYSVRDETVPRYRPKVLQSDSSARLRELQDHAVYERNSRHGGALRLSYQLPGVLAPDGAPWEPGMLVRVGDDEIGAHDTLVCARTELRVDGENLFTRLELAMVESYSTEPVPLRRLVKP
jgi:prophage tail gpP-like protein